MTNTISYNYNPDGSPASLAYPSNRQVTYTISNAQRLTVADDVANNIQFATAVSYAPPGDCKECSVAGGALVGYFIGGALANAIKSPASRGWSFARDVANCYMPSKGTIPQWLGTRPDAANAGGAALLVALAY